MKEIDYFHLDIPIFVPLYKDNVAYSYTGTGGKELLREILCKASDGYCMYCYSRIKIDGKIYAHVEHSVEKYLSKDLENCLSNLGLACSMCNQSYKRRRELNKDSLPNNVLHYMNEFNKHKCNSPAFCRSTCVEYEAFREAYACERNIVLQPFATYVNKECCRISYDVLKRRFVAASSSSPAVRKLVEAHIKRFCLNDSKCRTRELLRFCRDIMDGITKPVKGRYDNMIVDLFVDKIKNLSEENYKKICGLVVKMAFCQGDW